MTTVLHSDGVDFSATILCEYDAGVTIAGGNVSAIESEGTNTRIDPGERVVEDWAGPAVMVHRGEDGKLHIGCAPESRKLD